MILIECQVQCDVCGVGFVANLCPALSSGTNEKLINYRIHGIRFSDPVGYFIGHHIDNGKVVPTIYCPACWEKKNKVEEYE